MASKCESIAIVKKQSHKCHYIEVAKGAIFMEQNMRCGLICGRLAILKKNWTVKNATFEGVFFMFSWAFF